MNQPTEAQVKAAIAQAEAEAAASAKTDDVLAGIAAPAPTLGGRKIAALSFGRRAIIADAFETIKARKPAKDGAAGEDEPDISDMDAAMMTLFVMAGDGWTAKRIVDRGGGDALLRAAFDLADQSDPDEYADCLIYAGTKMNAIAAAQGVSGPSSPGPSRTDESSAEKNGQS